MKRILNFRVVEGDPNEVDKNEILLVRDNSTGKVKSIRERERWVYKGYFPRQYLENILKVLGFNIDLSKALEPISKEEFDSMDIPTLPLN